MKKLFSLTTAALLTINIFSGCDSSNINDLKWSQKTTIKIVELYDKELRDEDISPKFREFVLKEKQDKIAKYKKELNLAKQGGETIPECLNQVSYVCK